MYSIKKNGAMYEVRSPSGRVQYSSLKRINCVDWIAANTSSPTAESRKAS